MTTNQEDEAMTKTAKKPAAPKTFTLSEVLTDKHDPKVVRAKLRRAYADGGKGLPKVSADAWEWSVKDRKAVEALIASDRRRAE